MQIVGSSYFLRNLRNLDFFTLDLGKSKTEPKTKELRKIDEFIIKYRNLYNKDLLKFGKIGDTVTFYQDLQLGNNNYIIFNNEDIYEITFEDDEILNMENYILDTLRKIDETENEEKEMMEKNDKMIKEFTKENGWTAPKTDNKNAGKSYLINQTLSKEEYRKALLEKLEGTK